MGTSAQVRAVVAAQREEIARLKGLKGPPSIKPSGMDKATDAKPAGGKGRRRGGKLSRLTIDEERVVKVDVPNGSRFKGYEDYVVQDLIPRPHVVRYRRQEGFTAEERDVLRAGLETAWWITAEDDDRLQIVDNTIYFPLFVDGAEEGRDRIIVIGTPLPEHVRGNAIKEENRFQPP